MYVTIVSIGVFYWMLLNIHPAYRSSLHSIQLLAVVKSSHLKVYGIDAVLKPAIDDLLKLSHDVSACIILWHLPACWHPIGYTC